MSTHNHNEYIRKWDIINFLIFAVSMIIAVIGMVVISLGYTFLVISGFVTLFFGLVCAIGAISGVWEGVFK